MTNSKLLGVIVALQGLILLGQWTGAPNYLTHAQAQTDPARDRQQIVDEMRSTNAKLDKLIDILTSGELQVKVVAPDETKGKAGGR